MNPDKQNWQRMNEPILSALTTEEDWCKVTLYCPYVIKVGDVYKMWYLGNPTATRDGIIHMGYAESKDGVHWAPYKNNPILRSEDIKSGNSWQTPYIILDEKEGIYKMWFVSLARGQIGSDAIQRLGYATSFDGIKWDIVDESIYPSGRSPSIIMENGSYRMWMNSAPQESSNVEPLLTNIYQFTSHDGLSWNRSAEPVLRTKQSKKFESIVYPFVIKDNDTYIMWFGAHVREKERVLFEIFCATSKDGNDWELISDQSVLPASRDQAQFDGRYTSTPCVLEDDDRYLMYYSARDFKNEYIAGDGTRKVDNSGVYQHIGVAIMEK